MPFCSATKLGVVYYTEEVPNCSFKPNCTEQNPFCVCEGLKLTGQTEGNRDGEIDQVSKTVETPAANTLLEH